MIAWALPTRDLVFAAAQVVAVVGLVVVIYVVCLLLDTDELPVDEGEPEPVPRPAWRIVRRPFDWRRHPDL